MTTDTMQPDATTDNDTAPSFENYWGTNEVFRFPLPDGKQYFEVKALDEGGKAMFQKKTNKGIRVNQKTQDATLDMDPADERHALIKASVVGWNLMQPNGDGTFSQYPCPSDERLRTRELENTILQKFNPKMIQDLEFFIRTKNPWMQADMDVAEIDKEIDRLEELKKQAKESKTGE